MGKQNRQRRAEKQRQRRRSVAPQARQQTLEPPSGETFVPGRNDEGTSSSSQRPAPSALTAPEVAELVRLASSARSPLEHTQRAGIVDVLAAQADHPDGRTIVDRGIASATATLLAGLWEDGWQPVDLARIVAQRSSVDHRARLIDAVAGQSVDLALAHAPDGWRSQLDELGAHLWWDRRRPLIEQVAERRRLTLRRVVEVTIDVLAVLISLPTQPRLCPPPSAWNAATAQRPRAGGLDAKVLAKVRALLAKAESTEFPEEAEALSTKAQELITRHAIDQALLVAGDPADGAPPVGRRVPVEDPYATGKAQLLSAIARANRCRMVWDKSYGFGTVFGYAGDLDAVELLHASLLVQATSAMAAAGSQVDARGVSRTRSFRSSFLTAFAHRIGERLRATTETNIAAADEALGDGRLLPVLAAREDAVEAAVAEVFPGLVAHRTSVGNRAGWIAGRVAADRAELAVGPPLAGERRLSA